MYIGDKCIVYSMLAMLKNKNLCVAVLYVNSEIEERKVSQNPLTSPGSCTMRILTRRLPMLGALGALAKGSQKQTSVVIYSTKAWGCPVRYRGRMSYSGGGGCREMLDASEGPHFILVSPNG